MKQKYTKPVLIMESFSLTQSIAHNCGRNLDFNKATLKYAGSCGWDADGNPGTNFDVVFSAGQSVCKIQGEEFEGVCYNNPEGGFNVFNS